MAYTDTDGESVGDWTDPPRPLLPQTESEWQRFVTDYAESLGWDWLHIETRARRSQVNGAKGTLGKGWPDLLFVKGKKLFVAEMKAADGEMSDEQSRVRLKLMYAVDYYIWRPSDFARMAEVLNSRE